MTDAEIKFVIHLLKLAAEEIGNADDFEISSYTGRGMYSKKCLGIAADSIANALGLLAHAIKVKLYDLEDELCDEDSSAEDKGKIIEVIHRISNMVCDFDYDSMGRGVIVYWPSIVVTSEMFPYED